MKTTIKHITLKTAKVAAAAFVICGLALTSSCKKEGPAGPQGVAGTNGADGNANVQSTTVTVSGWSYSAPSYYTNITWSGITSSINTDGAVLVYVSNGGGGFSQLPLTMYLSSTYSSTMEVISYTGGVTIYWTDSDLTTPATPPNYTFKVVAIAPAGLAAHPGIDYKNYAAVKAAFNIKD